LEQRILIVEDDTHSREGLKTSLLAEGYRVETSGDGLQAIKKIKEHRFDIAIVDINLPPVLDVAISGWDLVHIFRSFDPAISIILVSAEEDIHTRAEQCGVACFLRKPIRVSQLKATLKTLYRYQEDVRQRLDRPGI
jgi:DNA-binding response OmpR family regulator